MSNILPQLKLFVGFDYRETSNYAVCCTSAVDRASRFLPITGLVLEKLIDAGLYKRPIQTDPNTGQLWDPISGAPMSTQFAISRFLTPTLAREGWALFVDCDVLFRANPWDILQHADPDKAVICVKHNYVPESEVKKQGAIQTKYSRKNWSSVMLFNCDHPSNKKLTVDLVNSVPGRDLHGFCWLKDEEIGELPVEWNFLVGVSKPGEGEPKLVHWTEGSPALPDYRDTLYSDEYFKTLHTWAYRGVYS